MSPVGAPATSGRGWGDEEQARLYVLAGLPPVHEVNGILKRNGIRYLIHPLLAMGGWASYEADLLGVAYTERAFGVRPRLRERFGAMEAVETHLIHRERSAFDPWVVRSTKGLGMRHHRALIYILLDTAEQIYDWSLTQLESFMAHPDGQIVVTTGRKGLRQITATKTYNEGRGVIQDLFGLAVSQPTYTRRRQLPGGGDELNLTWTTRRIIEGTSEAFKRGITMINGREVDTVTIGYSSYLVAAPQQITVSKDLVPWLWSSTQALRKQGIRPMDLQSRLDEEDSLMLRQSLLWDALAPVGWRIHELFAGLTHESEFLADIFGSYEHKKTRSSWLSANRKKERRGKARLSEPIGPLYDESVTLGSTMVPRPELGSDQPEVAATTTQIAEHNEFCLDYTEIDTPQESPCESRGGGAEVSLGGDEGAEVSPKTSKVSPEISKVSPTNETLSHQPNLNTHSVMDSHREMPRKLKSEGAEVSLTALETVQGAEVSPKISKVSLEISKVSLGPTAFVFNTLQFAYNNTFTSPTHVNTHKKDTSAQDANLDQNALGSSKVSLGPIFNTPTGNTSDNGFVPSSPSQPSSKQADSQSDVQDGGDLLACSPAGVEGDKTGRLTERIKGLSETEIQDLQERGILGTWGDSRLHERKCLLDLICAVEEEGLTLPPAEAKRMLSDGVMTARGAWAMVMCLKRRRHQGGSVKSICKSPHFNMRNWLAGNFLTRTGERNAFFRDFLGIASQLETLGWYERPIQVLTSSERQALGSLDQIEAKAFPLPEEERQEQARIASQVAQEARNASRPTLRTPESFLASQEDRVKLANLRDALTTWIATQTAAHIAWKTSQMENRELRPEEGAQIDEANRVNGVVEQALAATGPIQLPFGVARTNDRTQWRALLTALERIL